MSFILNFTKKQANQPNPNKFFLSTFWWIKVEVTKFDALAELIAEFRLKKLLWDSLEEWDSLSDGWKQVRCT